MLSPTGLDLASKYSSEDEEGRTVHIRASAAELFRRHFDDKAIEAKTRFKAASSMESHLRTSVAEGGASEDGLPQDLADKLVDHISYVVSFNPRQEWDGYVIKVNANSFRARLTDITRGGAQDDEEVEIPFSELDEVSQSQLTEGRLLRWSIGYQFSSTGEKTRVSRIIVRRLPAWRREDLERAKREATELSRKLKWE